MFKPETEQLVLTSCRIQ